MSQDLYDIVVVGGGPAGLTAGLYGARARLNTVILEKTRPGGQAATTEEIENWSGTIKIAGPKLMEQMAEHAEHFGARIVKDEAVELLVADDGTKVIKTKKGDVYRARAVILAMGAEPRMLGVKGERVLRGKGVSYCATCDADFFTDLDIVVVGNGDAAVEEAMYLTKFANSVTMIVIHDEGILDANKVSAEKAFRNEKIKWIWNSTVDEIKGDGIVESVVLKNIKTGELTEMPTNGVFIFVGTVPKTDFVRNIVQVDERGYIPVNEQMETNIDGVYAAGDCRQKYLRQVVTAAGDGATAAVAAEKYIQEEETFHEAVLAELRPVCVVFWSPFVEASLKTVTDAESVLHDLGDKIKIVKLDTYRNQRVAKRYGVTKIPSVLFFKGGKALTLLSENVTAEMIEATVKSLL